MDMPLRHHIEIVLRVMLDLNPSFSRLLNAIRYQSPVFTPGQIYLLLNAEFVDLSPERKAKPIQ